MQQISTAVKKIISPICKSLIAVALVTFICYILLFWVSIGMALGTIFGGILGVIIEKLAPNNKKNLNIAMYTGTGFGAFLGVLIDLCFMYTCYRRANSTNPTTTNVTPPELGNLDSDTPPVTTIPQTPINLNNTVPPVQNVTHASNPNIMYNNAPATNDKKDISIEPGNIDKNEIKKYPT